MKNTNLLFIAGAASALGLLAGCSHAEPKTYGQQRNIGMANPASVYCASLKGQLDSVQGPNGTSSYCTLPNGERIEEWALFRRDHPQK